MRWNQMDRRIMLQSMMQIRREAGSTISRILDVIVPEKYIGCAELGPSGRGCAKSPVGLCVYDSNDVHIDRWCIFCNCPKAMSGPQDHLFGVGECVEHGEYFLDVYDSPCPSCEDE